MTHRSDLTTEIEKALTDEVHDGAFGPLNEKQFPAYVRRLAEAAAVAIAEQQGQPADGRVEAAARRLFGATVDSMSLARELARVALTAPPLIECPHWAPGKVTFRNGCTACAAGAAGERGTDV